MSTEARELLRRFYGAFERGDLQGLAALVSSDFLFVPAGRHGPLAGARRGPEAMLGFARLQLELTGGTWVPRPYDLLLGESHAAVLVEVSARRADRARVFRLIHVWRIEGGVAVELRSCAEEPYEYDAFFSAER